MSARSLNKVMLIGNLTRDPELRYTPQGTAVCSFGLATNRSWMPEGATERREETEFHRIVAWNKLAELCSQLLSKGRKAFVEGRLQTRSWTAPDGNQRTATEIVIDDMIILDSRRVTEELVTAPVAEPAVTAPTDVGTGVQVSQQAVASSAQNQPTDDDSVKDEGKKPDTEENKEEKKDDINPDDIPF